MRLAASGAVRNLCITGGPSVWYAHGTLPMAAKTPTDSARPCHICPGTWAQPPQHLHRDWAHSAIGTGLVPPHLHQGVGLPLPHPHRDGARSKKLMDEDGLFVPLQQLAMQSGAAPTPLYLRAAAAHKP